jgi:hypothetical protein
VNNSTSPTPPFVAEFIRHIEKDGLLPGNIQVEIIQMATIYISRAYHPAGYQQAAAGLYDDLRLSLDRLSKGIALAAMPPLGSA